MSEAMTSQGATLPAHPRAEICRETIELFMSHGIGAHCRFVQRGGWFTTELTTKDKLFSWNQDHGGYFKRYSTDLDSWQYRDYDDFCRIMRSPELYAEICTDNIRIYKHRDHSV